MTRLAGLHHSVTKQEGSVGVTTKTNDTPEWPHDAPGRLASNTEDIARAESGSQLPGQGRHSDWARNSGAGRCHRELPQQLEELMRVVQWSHEDQRPDNKGGVDAVFYTGPKVRE